MSSSRGLVVAGFVLKNPALGDGGFGGGQTHSTGEDRIWRELTCNRLGANPKAICNNLIDNPVQGRRRGYVQPQTSTVD
jgi:hypothetical protein